MGFVRLRVEFAKRVSQVQVLFVENESGHTDIMILGPDKKFNLFGVGAG